MGFREQLEQFQPDLSLPFPYNPMIPKGIDKNLHWRRVMDRLGEEDEDDRRLILDCCARDLLFFINGFLWIKQDIPVPADLPFITWDMQDKLALLMYETRKRVESDSTGSERGNYGCDKPRGVGATWLHVAEGLHIVRFTSGAIGIMGSRVEDSVERSGVPNTLFWKFDYLVEHLPKWFMPCDYWSKKEGWPVVRSPACKTHMKRVIPGFGTMDGSSTHKDFCRQLRYFWMLLDEFPFVDRGQLGMGDHIWGGTTSVSRLRRVVGTPNGRANKFARLRFGGELPWFTFKWTDDPAKMAGAYRLEADMTVGPVTVKAGEWWSPWAESERKAVGDDALFAQEYLLSYEGIGGSFYDALLQRVEQEIQTPLFTGNLRISESRIVGLEPKLDGVFSHWEHPGQDFKWKKGRYVMGVDVASGSTDFEGRGASNSVVAVGRLSENGLGVTKIAQYRTHGLLAHLFSKIACAIGWSFVDHSGIPAYVLFERDGPGDTFGHTLVRDFQYPNVYWENDSKGGARAGFKMTTFRNSDGTLAGSRVNVFNEHKKWLSSGLYKEPSMDTLLEMQQFVYDADGGAEHCLQKNSLDRSGARANHGDSVVATALMVWAARLLGSQKQQETIPDPPFSSFAWAEQKRKRETSGLWR